MSSTYGTIDQAPTFRRLRDGGWVRDDPWQTVVIRGVHVYDQHDLSHRWDHGTHYDSRGNWCWLGYTHSTKEHEGEVRSFVHDIPQRP